MHEYRAPNGSLSISERDGVVIVTGEGFWQDEGVEQHFAYLKRLVDGRRLLCRPMLGLIDLRKSAVQRPSLIEQIKTNAHGTWRPSDRVAILLASSLLRMQMERVAAGSTFRLFSSHEQACSWLEPERPIPAGGGHAAQGRRGFASDITF